MLGAVIGDIIGSVAVADALLNREHSNINPRKSYAMWYRQYYHRYPDAGYGQMFSQWASAGNFAVQRSYGNGGAMRVTAIGYAMDSIQNIRREVNYSCHYTHNTKEAKRGAEAVAVCIFLARTGSSREEIRKYIEQNYKYALPKLKDIRDEYVFDSRTSYSVPPAIEAFLESDSYEDAIRNAVSIGGDSDTIACMTGGIAEAFYGGVPDEIRNRAMSILDIGLKSTIDLFMSSYSSVPTPEEGAHMSGCCTCTKR